MERWLVNRKIFIVGTIRFNTNLIIIYSVVILMFFSALIPGLISNIASADPYNGPDYYVSVTGNNANDGSYEYPWATLNYAMGKVDAGDTVYVMAGIYLNTKSINWGKAGTPNAWITYTAYGDGEVILDGTGTSYDGWSGIFYLYDQRYIRISGFIIRNAPNWGIIIEKNADTDNCHNITIDNCTIYNCTESGICFRAASSNHPIRDILVENCTISDCQNGYSGPRGQEVVTFCTCQRFICRYNYIYDGNFVGIDVKASCSKGFIYNNKIDTNNMLGFYVDGASTFCHNISFFNNIAWGSGTGYTIAAEAGGNVRDISFYNNIYNGTQYAFKISWENNYVKRNIKVINNVVASSSIGFLIQSENDNCINLTIRNNIFKGSRGIDTSLGINLATHNVDYNLYDVTTSDYYGSNSINGSPCFVNPNNSNYHLLENSPAIDSGSFNNAPAVDFDGVNRPQGSSIDIGAFEFLMSDDNIPPQISNISVVTSNPFDTNPSYGWVNISCMVTDNIEVSQVNLRIHNPDGSWNNVTMTKKSSGKYYYRTTTDFSSGGNYSHTIRAKDTSNNTVISPNLLLLIPPNWDMNNDGSCNILDLVLISNQFSLTGYSGWIREDVDNNGLINVLDMSLSSNHFGENWYT